jgi:hypothetical protein
MSLKYHDSNAPRSEKKKRKEKQASCERKLVCDLQASVIATDIIRLVHNK